MNYYNQALQKIKCAQQQFSTAGCCCIGNIGSTGPTGPAGPATITIGATTTGAPGTAASVVNVGTSDNAILNFTIPQGPTGPTGATGATGSQGDIGATGPAPTITVNPVINGAAGTDAAVDITGSDGAYALTFTIPAGPTGPTGNGLAAYGGAYNDTSTAYTLSANTPSQITLPTAMPVLNTNAAGNEIAITEDGDYEIVYAANVTETGTDPITFSVRNTDVDIPGTTIEHTFTANGQYNYSGSIIVDLSAGDTIDMALTSTATPSGNITNASLVVKKLDGGTPAN